MPNEEILKILQGLLTPVIGIVATYIAWQQWKTNRNKLNLDRYDRRMRVYQEVVRFISIGIRYDNYDDDELLNFRPKVSERSEERRVGKECRSRSTMRHDK